MLTTVVDRLTGAGGRADFCFSAIALALLYYTPSMAIRFRRQAYMDVLIQHQNFIAHWLWLTILDNLGARPLTGQPGPKVD